MEGFEGKACESDRLRHCSRLRLCTFVIRYPATDYGSQGMGMGYGQMDYSATNQYGVPVRGMLLLVSKELRIVTR